MSGARARRACARIDAPFLAAAQVVVMLAVVPSLVAQQRLPADTVKAAPAMTRPRTVAEDLQLFSQVFNQIRVNHPDSLDSHRLFLSAIQAMVQATDPHSYVIPAVRLSPGKEAELRAGEAPSRSGGLHDVGRGRGRRARRGRDAGGAAGHPAG